jgi:WD40 repeat protein
MSLHVFDSLTWRNVASRTYEEDVAGAAFDAGNRWLVGVTGTSVVVLEPGGWRERLRLQHDGTIEGVKVSPNGRQLGTTTHWFAGHDKGVYLTRVFDLASGNETGWEYTSGGGNISQQFMQDEAAHKQRALAGGDMASVRAVSSWPALELTEPYNRVSADGAWNVRVSGSLARLQDMAAKRDIGNLDHGGEITSVRFVPALAPRWLVTAGKDGTLALWPLRTDDLVQEACTRLRAIFDPQALSKLIADAHAEGSCEAK